MLLHSIDVGSIPTLTTKTCKVCDTVFTPGKNSKGLYCSRKCSSASRRKTGKCTWCGSVFWTPATKNSVVKYCSVACEHNCKYEEVYVQRLESGQTLDASTEYVKRYLRERDGHSCVVCTQGPTHNGKPLVLQVDHIDGNSDNNFPSNLRLLCPNCHTQTETFSRRTVRDTRRNRYRRKYKSGTA